MSARYCAGYELVEALASTNDEIEYWRARGPDGGADVYIGGDSLLTRGRVLPQWGPFARVRTGDTQAGSYVLVRGTLKTKLSDLGAKLSPVAALGVVWHIAYALAEMHERGESHGALHPDCMGLDEQGALMIRPAFGCQVLDEPDEAATSQATDCWRFGSVMTAMGVDRLDDINLELIRRSLGRPVARRRMQPGRAVRQALAATLARHPEWEQSLVDALGEAWSPDRRPWSDLDDRLAAIQVGVTDVTSELRLNPIEVASTIVEVDAEADVEDELSAEPEESLEEEVEESLEPDEALEEEVEESLEPEEAVEEEVEESLEPEEALEEEVEESLEPEEALEAEFDEEFDEEVEEEPEDALEAEFDEEVEESLEVEEEPEPEDAFEEAFEDAFEEALEVEEDLEEALEIVFEDPVDVAIAAPSPTPVQTPTPVEPVEPVEPVQRPSPIRRPVQADPIAPSPDALSKALPGTTDKVPRWLGARGVSNTTDRDEELGIGKWAESGRTLDEVKRAMDSSPVRELDIGSPGLPWGWIIFLGSLVLGAAWLWLKPLDEAPAAKTKGRVQFAVEASPDSPRVTVVSVPANAMIILDGEEMGRSPTSVPVPTDTRLHELCIEQDDVRNCRNLTGAALSREDPYRFTVEQR